MIKLDRAWLAANPLPEPAPDSDKNQRGRVLAAGGSERVPGALRLTGEAALRVGAGKLQLAVPERVAMPLGVAMPEAAVFGLPVNAEGELGQAAGELVADLMDRCDALVLGPGTGAEADAHGLLTPIVARPAAALVLDAAMLGAAPHAIDALRSWNASLVLTPHYGEMAALMQCEESSVRDSPETLAREAAERFDATIVLKGPHSWIISPGRESLCFPGGGVGLATGGSGDVLAGLIGGLLARGAPADVAAAWGVWLHGEAGRVLTRKMGRLGFLGRELIAEMPALLEGI